MKAEVTRAKQKIDRLGGVGSLIAGVICLAIGIYDLHGGHGIWKVWAGMCLLLVFNGLLMLREAKRAVVRPKPGAAKRSLG